MATRADEVGGFRGPRGDCNATDTDDPTEEPRFGRVGKQVIEDTGPLTRKRMETVEDDLLVAQHNPYACVDASVRTTACGVPLSCP
jgi:hypothetical protein